MSHDPWVCSVSSAPHGVVSREVMSEVEEVDGIFEQTGGEGT